MTRLNVRQLDRAGTIASSLCALHCALVALLPALPATMLGIFGSERMEAVLLALALIVGVSAIAAGFVRIHRDIRPVLLLCAGISLLVARSLLHVSGTWELVCSVVGASCLVGAHRWNSRLSGRRCCQGCDVTP